MNLTEASLCGPSEATEPPPKRLCTVLQSRWGSSLVSTHMSDRLPPASAQPSPSLHQLRDIGRRSCPLCTQHLALCTPAWTESLGRVPNTAPSSATTAALGAAAGPHTRQERLSAALQAGQAEPGAARSKAISEAVQAQSGAARSQAISEAVRAESGAARSQAISAAVQAQAGAARSQAISDAVHAESGTARSQAISEAISDQVQKEIDAQMVSHI